MGILEPFPALTLHECFTVRDVMRGKERCDFLSRGEVGIAVGFPTVEIEIGMPCMQSWPWLLSELHTSQLH